MDEQVPGGNILEQTMERIRLALAKHPVEERDRKFDLVCAALSGAGASGTQTPKEVAERAIEIANATLLLLGKK